MKVGITYNLKSEIEALDTDFLRAEDMFEEFDAPETIDAISSAIGNMGHECVRLGFGRPALEKILKDRVEFVFNIAEGYFGRARESHMPALLEMLRIPHTGPDPMAAVLSLDKIMAKSIASGAGVATPAHVVFWPNEEEALEGLPEFPLIPKLAYEGSSIGIREHSKVGDRDELLGQIAWLRENYPPQPIIVERFIGGREFTVGVIGNEDPEILGIMEIIPRDVEIEDFLYSLEVKRNYLTRVKYSCPADVNEFLKKRLEAAALRLYFTFGCRDISRFDFRIDEYGTPHFLEVNTLPGLHPVSSDIVIMCRLRGIEYGELIKRIFNHARARYNSRNA